MNLTYPNRHEFDVSKRAFAFTPSKTYQCCQAQNIRCQIDLASLDQSPYLGSLVIGHNLGRDGWIESSFWVFTFVFFFCFFARKFVFENKYQAICDSDSLTIQIFLMMFFNSVLKHADDFFFGWNVV